MCICVPANVSELTWIMSPYRQRDPTLVQSENEREMMKGKGTEVAL